MGGGGGGGRIVYYDTTCILLYCTWHLHITIKFIDLNFSTKRYFDSTFTNFIVYVNADGFTSPIRNIHNVLPKRIYTLCTHIRKGKVTTKSVVYIVTAS